MVEAVKNAAHDSRHEKASYYCLAYETLRGKLGHTDAMFRSLLLPLFGDKDQEKILDIVAKVEKAHQRQLPPSLPQRPSYMPYSTVRCYGCNRLGIFVLIVIR